eukprot:CAMPEP_0194365434 /NCGR_PEP_ID=MMETSP0174-20130528/13488_1 /TAXON_ID=216777 /ORGANISM="Proboscia alata, Strain PI-D3" /LENGTH=392 /DNA_ID=CAMNT_0039140137 /DNA_START=47 /DNA_END=1222 /DNA_ORIENTATION=+
MESQFSKACKKILTNLTNPTNHDSAYCGILGDNNTEENGKYLSRWIIPECEQLERTLKSKSISLGKSNSVEYLAAVCLEHVMRYPSPTSLSLIQFTPPSIEIIANALNSTGGRKKNDFRDFHLRVGNILRNNSTKPGKKPIATATAAKPNDGTSSHSAQQLMNKLFIKLGSHLDSNCQSEALDLYTNIEKGLSKHDLINFSKEYQAACFYVVGTNATAESYQKGPNVRHGMHSRKFMKIAPRKKRKENEEGQQWHTEEPLSQESIIREAQLDPSQFEVKLSYVKLAQQSLNKVNEKSDEIEGCSTKQVKQKKVRHAQNFSHDSTNIPPVPSGQYPSASNDSVSSLLYSNENSLVDELYPSKLNGNVTSPKKTSVLDEKMNELLNGTSDFNNW